MEIVAVLFLAFLCEGLVEYLASPWFPSQPTDGLPGRMALRYIAVLVGIGLALAYRADVLQLLGLTARVNLVGQILTGILVGRGSNYMNDLADRWLKGDTHASSV